MILKLQLQDNSTKCSKRNGDFATDISVGGPFQEMYQSQIQLLWINPLNSLVTIDQINVSNDGSFTTSVSTAGNLWKYDGTYTIKVNYGSLDQ